MKIIINYLMMVVFITMGIYVFKGYDTMIFFLDGFMKPIILTSPITLSLGAMVLIKEFGKGEKKK